MADKKHTWTFLTWSFETLYIDSIQEVKLICNIQKLGK